MPDLTAIFEFSRNHCIAICAFLIPANLLATLQTVIFIAFERSKAQIIFSAILANIFIFALLLHVFTWFSIGVVTPVTFILSSLGSTCLVINFFATKYPGLIKNSKLKIQNYFG